MAGTRRGVTLASIATGLVASAALALAPALSRALRPEPTRRYFRRLYQRHLILDFCPMTAPRRILDARSEIADDRAHCGAVAVNAPASYLANLSAASELGLDMISRGVSWPSRQSWARSDCMPLATSCGHWLAIEMAKERVTASYRVFARREIASPPGGRRRCNKRAQRRSEGRSHCT
jgi:hypothetical protein